MSTWRDEILKQFVPSVARLTLVADPDGLLLEERMLEGIRARGFELLPFEDHIAFRYAYESTFRSRWDRGEDTDLVVVLRSNANDLGSLPYDLLQAGRKLSFNLGEIFPNLSYGVVATLDRQDLDTLHEALKRHAPGQLGENASKEFVLRHVFEVAPELIRTWSDLLRMLLRRHYREQRIPAMLDERLIQLLRQESVFDDWPLEILLPDREAFFAFLQERWPIFLDRQAADASTGQDEESPRRLTMKGPADLPFDHQDIRVYIDNLFLEGFLQPVSHEDAETLSKTWAGIGVQSDPFEQRSRRRTKLVERLQESIPFQDARHGDWLHFAHAWAELVVLMNESVAVPDEAKECMTGLQTQVDAAFTAWLLKRYASLVNLPPTPPVMLHHLPRFLSRQIEDCPDAKIALLLVDGLSVDQWLIVAATLGAREPALKFREHAIFTWVPSITSVCRQTAFAGKAPLFFPGSIERTDKDSAHWMQFWTGQGLAPNEVVFAKGLGDAGLESLSEALAHPKAKIAGLIIDKIDKIMHGMQMGTAGMHNQVRQWAEQPYFASLLKMLLDRGFRIYLTSDHGNIEAAGCGRPAEGAVADLRSQRIRIYPDALLRSTVKERFPAAIEWEPVGLPGDYLPLIAPARQAFVDEKERVVNHGGICLEEVIVPLVEIERRDT